MAIVLPVLLSAVVERASSLQISARVVNEMEDLLRHVDPVELYAGQGEEGRRWLVELRDILYDVEDILDEVEMAKLKRGIPSLPIQCLRSPLAYFQDRLFILRTKRKLDAVNSRLTKIRVARGKLDSVPCALPYMAVEFLSMGMASVRDWFEECMALGSGKLMASSQAFELDVDYGTMACFGEPILLSSHSGVVHLAGAPEEPVAEVGDGEGVHEEHAADEGDGEGVHEEPAADVGDGEDVRRMVGLLMEAGKWSLIIGIVGIAGIGKTTLSQKVFSDTAIVSHFDIRMWASTSPGSSGADLLKQMIRSARGSCRDTETEVDLEAMLRDSVRERRFLLVVDDVQDEQPLLDLVRGPLKTGAAYSRVLVTARDESVLRTIGANHIYRLHPLSDLDAWLLFCNVLGSTVDYDLTDIGLRIVSKCDGLPVSIKAVAALLRTKQRTPAQWRMVLRDLVRYGRVDGVMAANYLRYNDLPSFMQQCFVYCYLFPPDFKFHRQDLVQMWHAQGFITDAQEGVAEECYEKLIRRDFLQVTQDGGSRFSCTPRAHMRDVARFVAHDEYILEEDELPKDPSARHRHVSFIGKGVQVIPDAITKHLSLKTLILRHNPLSKCNLNDLFISLKHLSVLDLSHTRIDDLPDSIGNLLLLKYINLSFTRLRELPESIRCLQSLQTLNVDCCPYLHKLPNCIVELSNLRDLMTDGTGIDHFPVGLSIRLPQICTLNGFIVCNSIQAEGDHQHHCNIKELKFLSKLSHLNVYKLEMVHNTADANEASLSDKHKLKVLKLACTTRGNGWQCSEDEVKRLEDVFKELLPPKSIEDLTIDGYSGRELPNWISDVSLCNLSYLQLQNCMLLTKLPQLDELPQLRVLRISGMPAVTTLGSDSPRSTAAVFPKLQDLTMEDMPNWEEWQGLGKEALPCLRRLAIISCSRLRSLPKGLKHATALTELEVRDSSSLLAIENLVSVTEMTIADNRNLTCLTRLPLLQRLTVENCPMLNDMENLGRLRYLRLEDVGMDTLPEWIQSITVLHRLVIEGNIDLLRRCHLDHEEWPKINHIPYVDAWSYDGSKFVSYTKTPFSFDSNL